MAVTISTHNGARVARSHNLRIRETVAHEKHIDPRGHHETWADIPLAKAYDILFGDAVKEYNEQQKRQATEKIHQASYTLEEGELPDWIERKGILRHTYTVQEDHLDRIHELLAADTLRDALRDVQSAYECTYDRLLESEREALTREKGALEAKVKALEHECRDLEQERSMMLQKVRKQDWKIERLEGFIEDHNLSNAYEREREWGHQDLIREWEVER